jgi:hypothetical protein
MNFDLQRELEAISRAFRGGELTGREVWERRAEAHRDYLAAKQQARQDEEGEEEG